MVASSLFSAPAAVILNRRLISQRGGIIPHASQSEDSLRFKLFVNSNPSSVRYGLTLQISALRDMSKEHNVDQIPEHPAYIYFPTSSFFHFHCLTPSRAGIQREEMDEMDITEEQALDILRTFRMFWVKGDANYSELRHLMVKCTGALVDTNTVPKLRSEALECELARIFGTIKTANELDDAYLELDFLLPAMKGQTGRAVAVMYDAAAVDLEVREVKKLAAEKKQSTPGAESQKSWRASTSDAAKSHKPKENSFTEKPDTAKAEGNGKTNTPKKPFIPAIIDGKFVSPDKTPLFHNENRPPTHKAKGYTSTSSPQKYLHPHTFDSEITNQFDATGSEKTSLSA